MVWSLTRVSPLVLVSLLYSVCYWEMLTEWSVFSNFSHSNCTQCGCSQLCWKTVMWKLQKSFYLYASSVKWMALSSHYREGRNMRRSICWIQVPNMSLFFSQIRTLSEPWRYFCLWLLTYLWLAIASHPSKYPGSFIPSILSTTSDEAEVLWSTSCIMWHWLILPTGQINFLFFSLPLTTSVLWNLCHLISQRILLTADELSIADIFS